MRIVIVEDNQTLASAIAHRLRDDGHAIDVLHDGNDGMDFLSHEDADLIILDINLPGKSGLEILRYYRASHKTAPVILLTARAETEERVAGLDAGADDYLVKPFEMAELEARIRALLRRKHTTTKPIEIIGKLEFDRGGRLVHSGGDILDIPRRELSVFECLCDRRDQIVSKAILADHLYGIGADIEERVIEVYISRLRKRIAPYDVLIKTARGLGYMLTTKA